MDGIKKIAIEMINADGIINLSRAGLCERAGIADGSFPYVMGKTFTDFIEDLRAEGFVGPLKKAIKTRTNPSLRKEHILEMALDVAKATGYAVMTREQIAEAAGVSASLISQYYSMPELRRAVMVRAVTLEVFEVIAQGLTAKDPIAIDAPSQLRNEAIKHLVNS